MNEQALLKRKIEAAKFAAWELHLFLDSHPHNKQAALKLDEYNKNIKAMKAEYEKKYGKLFPTTKDTSRFEWISSPWPWETEESCYVDL
ncbi:MAG: spore coat protein CotJB [Clostridia bacterium]|nr:spore coat protein CotJB [Clostridia bacterium]